MKPITHRQRQVLDFVRQHALEKGYPPTLREISCRFSLSGPRAAAKHIEALQKKGALRREPGISRGLGVSGTGIGESVRRLPLLGSVPAGPWDLALEDPGPSVLLDERLAGEGSFFLRVSGDSMSGDHIVPGDFVLVKPQDRAEDGDLVVALTGDEATLKRYRKTTASITLLPSNPDYSPVALTENDGHVRILGKVKAVLRMTEGSRWRG